MRQIVKDNIYIISGIILLNIVSYFVFVRMDFTANSRYSLSKVSKNFIRNNQEPITVDFYVTEDLPQDLKKVAKEFKALLKEYKSLSNTSFTINTIYPDNNEKGIQAIEAGIHPLYKEFREMDMEKIQKIFMGAVFKIGEKQSVIPAISAETPIEYEITRILKQASDTQKPVIGFVMGHGEAPLNRMALFINELSHLTDMSMIDLNSSEPLEKYSALCIIDPQDNYKPEELDLLENYLNQGGRLFIALNHAKGQINDSQNHGFINRTGIEDRLEKKGLKIRYDFVIDNNCGTLTFNQKHGFINFQNNISFPYLPIINNFSKHTITAGLNSMLLPFASSIEQVKTTSTYIFTPLARTSSMSGIQQAPLFFNLQKQWNRRDFNHPYNTVAALLINDDNNSAIITITDADFIMNDIERLGYTDNINFALNSIEWLADNSGLIQLRNKFTIFTSLDPVDEPTKEFLKYLNFFLPILIILIAAIVHFRKNQRKRINRSRPGYVD